MNNRDRDNDLAIDEFDMPDIDDTTEKNKKGVLVIGGAVLAIMLLGVAIYQFAGSSSTDENAGFTPPPAVVSVANTQEILMSPSTTLPGTVVSVRDSVIAAETSGKVVSVALVGELVEQGQALATIDRKNAEQQLAQHKADVDRLQSLYQYHKDYFARVNLDEQRLGIPEIAIAELRSNMETAKADLARAMAQLDASKTDLERTTIVAPFSGRVVSQMIQPGEFAQVGNPIVRLVDINSLEISAQVPAALVQPLEAGIALEVSGYGKTIAAPLRALVPVGNEVSRTMELRVQLPNSDFLVGSSVRVKLPTATPKQVLAIPRDAVILRPNSQYVFVVDQDAKAHKRMVELGYAQDQLIEVIGDVALNDKVIIRGGERLRDGQSVKFEDVPTAAETLSVSKLN